MFLNLREDKKAFSTMEACHYGMKSLFENNPRKELFNEVVLKDVKGRVFEIEEIGLVKVIDSHQCDVVAKDAKGHRSYRVKLEKNSSFDHLYRIIDVSGQKIVSDYQWRASL